MTATAHPTFTEAIAGRKRVLADAKAADRLLRAAVRRATDDLRHGATAADVEHTLTTAGTAAALLLDD